MCAVLWGSLSRYGIPDEILTDNGKVFTGRFGPQPVEVLFDRICRENGISHRHTAVRSPTTTGKIERFHQSLRKEFLADRSFTSLERAQAELDPQTGLDPQPDRGFRRAAFGSKRRRSRARVAGSPCQCSVTTSLPAVRRR